MAGFLDSLLPGIGGLESIIGLIGDSSARQRALQQQQQALQDYGSAADQQYQAMLGNNSRTLMGAAGQGATALTNLGSNLGAANAAAGITNSSAVGGSLALGQQATDTSVASLAAQNQYNAGTIHNQALQNLASMRLGQANTNYANANNDYRGDQAGFANFLGTLAQSNLLGNHAQSNPYMGQTSYAGADYGPSDSQLGLGGGGGTGMSGMYDGSSQIQSYAPAGSASSLGSQGQYNLQALGGNYARIGLPQVNGTINQGVNLGGNAGGIGNGGLGQMGNNPFYQPAPGQRRARSYSDIVNTPLGGR